jgi:uncharacterized protein YaiE (UPF0345 family)
MRHPARPAPAHRRRGNPASWPRRLAVTAALAVASTTVLVTGIATPAFAGSLVSPGWAASATAPGTLGVDYTYTFTTASTSELDSVTMTVPDGTGGSPSAATVTPARVADGGSVSLSGSTLTYSFTPGTVEAGTAVSIEVTGLGNTTMTGSYTSDIATVDAGTPVDSGTTPAVSFSGTLVSPGWAVSTATPGAPGADYTYTFTTASSAELDSVTMTVPTGTGGFPAVGVVTPAAVANGGNVSLADGTLTYSFTPGTVVAGTTISIEITGLANTSAGGSYTSDITTVAADTPVDSGTTPAVSFSAPLVSPRWAVSNTAPGGTGADYTYTFTTASTSELDSVTMTVPAGTGGSPAVGAVTPAAVATGGTVSLADDTLTYSFTAGAVEAGTTVSIEITGLANTTVAGSYTSDITTVAADTPVDSGTTPAISFSATLVSPDWTVSDTAPGGTGVDYTYTFTTASSSELDSVTMTVPAGTGGSPAVGTVTPAAVAAGGTVSLADDTLTYSFTPGTVEAGTAVSIEITGLANTTVAGSYTSDIATVDADTPVDSGTTPAVAFGGTLAQLGWRVSDSTPAATGVHYTYTFTTASSSELDSVTMTVPAGTGGSPAVGAVTPTAVADGGTVSLADDTLTYSFTPGTVEAGTAVSIEITGLTNTTVAGSYTSDVTTQDAGRGVDSGTTPGVSFPGTLTLASPGSLAWATQENGLNQSSAAGEPADQQLTVNDSSGTGSGWNVTVSATTFSSGSHTLPDTAGLEFNGSASSLTGAAPSAACVGSCVLPVDTTTYPVAIDTAASSPDTFTIYDASPGTGSGVVALGGPNTTHPIGWWIQVPASAYAGSYTSTLTLTLVSGP